MSSAASTTPGFLVREVDWPKPLDRAALTGPAGEFATHLAPYTEADEAALLLQFLCYAGNVLGRQCVFRVEADEHPPSLFVAIVGETSKARKGT